MTQQVIDLHLFRFIPEIIQGIFPLISDVHSEIPLNNSISTKTAAGFPLEILSGIL